MKFKTERSSNLQYFASYRIFRTVFWVCKKSTLESVLCSAYLQFSNSGLIGILKGTALKI